LAMQQLGWCLEPVTAEIFDFLDHRRTKSADVIIANLVLHHFSDDALRALFARSQHRAKAIAACEPRRGFAALTAARLVSIIGCNEVTQHDAVASVRAGFRDKEVSALFPVSAEWDLRECAAIPFTHCFAARRAARHDPGP
ncbi:MAG: hypothetical protein KGJ78_18830, partial [Alphaproteobacteria bacterium]|nr:hypothetical protein [Alphaproteobacteria bacterium]